MSVGEGLAPPAYSASSRTPNHNLNKQWRALRVRTHDFSMTNKTDLPKRKPNRLKNFDYSQNGAYFITICTKDKKNFLSRIVGKTRLCSTPLGNYEKSYPSPICTPTPVGEGLAPPVSELTKCGEAVKQEIISIEQRFPSVKIDRYVIMPNHVHMIILLYQGSGDSGGASPSPTISNIICAFKSKATRICKAERLFEGEKLFQRSFHDHIIRNKDSYLEISRYIENNPMYWQEDCFYTEQE